MKRKLKVFLVPILFAVVGIGLAASVDSIKNGDFVIEAKAESATVSYVSMENEYGYNPNVSNTALTYLVKFSSKLGSAEDATNIASTLGDNVKFNGVAVKDISGAAISYAHGGPYMCVQLPTSYIKSLTARPQLEIAEGTAFKDQYLPAVKLEMDLEIHKFREVKTYATNARLNQHNNPNAGSTTQTKLLYLFEFNETMGDAATGGNELTNVLKNDLYLNGVALDSSNASVTYEQGSTYMLVRFNRDLVKAGQINVFRIMGGAVFKNYALPEQVYKIDNTSYAMTAYPMDNTLSISWNNIDYSASCPEGAITPAHGISLNLKGNVRIDPNATGSTENIVSTSEIGTKVKFNDVPLKDVPGAYAAFISSGTHLYIYIPIEDDYSNFFSASGYPTLTFEKDIKMNSSMLAGGVTYYFFGCLGYANSWITTPPGTSAVTYNKIQWNNKDYGGYGHNGLLWSYTSNLSAKGKFINGDAKHANFADKDIGDHVYLNGVKFSAIQGAEICYFSQGNLWVYAPNMITKGNVITVDAGTEFFDSKLPAQAFISDGSAWADAHKVTFDTQGGDVMADKYVAHNSALGNVTPTYKSHVFKGWTKGGVDYDVSSKITEDISLAAKWADGVYVTFDSDGGSAVDTQLIEKGTKATNPGAPKTAKEGHTFVEWQKDGVAFDFDSAVSADISLKATWEINKYDVTFEPDNGEQATVRSDVTWGTTTTAPVNDPTKDEYTFQGWYYGETQFSETYLIKDDITFTAKWKPDYTKAGVVKAQISALGTITLDKESAVTAARSAYDALSDLQKSAVDNLGVLEAAETKIANLKAAKSIDDEIAAIGTVTLAKESAIVAARSSYDNATAGAKAEVTKLTVLTDAEARLAVLKGAKAIDDEIAAIGTVTLAKESAIVTARSNYTAASGDVKAEVTNLSVLEAAEARLAVLKGAKAIDDEIAAIGTVTLDKKAAIETARANYDKASKDIQDEVTKLADLVTAESRLAVLQAAKAIDDEIAAIGTVTLAKEETIETARDNYDKATKAVQDEVTKLDVLIAAETRLGVLQAAKAIDDEITAIGTVTLSKETAIQTARGNYDKATKAVQDEVTKLADLVAAETKLANLKAAKAIDDEIAAIGTVTLAKENAIVAARGSYDGATADVKAEVTKLSVLTEAEARLAILKAAKAIDDEIVAIGTVSLDKENAIVAARGSYDSATADVKAEVSKLSTLEAAEARLAILKAAKAIDDEIVAIGTVTLDKENAIVAARSNYDKASADVKAEVTKLTVLTDAEARLAVLKAAKAIDDEIDAIGEVSLEKASAIASARSNYDKASADVKAEVTKLTVLEQAETTLAHLIEIAEYKIAQKVILEGYVDKADYTVNAEPLNVALEAGKAAIDACESKESIDIAVSAAKLVIDGIDSDAVVADKAAAAVVVNKINAIGEVTLEKESQIVEARSSYNGLTQAQKSYVTNLETLTAAEAKLSDLKVLKAAKEAGVKAIDDYKATIDMGKYYEEGKKQIESLTSSAKEAINNASDAATIDLIVNKYKEEVGKVAQRTGCGGSITAASGVVALVALLGVGLTIKKKKEDK